MLLFFSSRYPNPQTSFYTRASLQPRYPIPMDPPPFLKMLDFDQVNSDLGDLADDFDRLMPTLRAAKALFTPEQVVELSETMTWLESRLHNVGKCLDSPEQDRIQESDNLRRKVDCIMHSRIQGEKGKSYAGLSNMQETMAAIFNDVLPKEKWSRERQGLVQDLLRYVRNSGFSTVVVWSTCFTVRDWKTIQMSVLYAVLGRVNNEIKVRTISPTMHDTLHRLSSTISLHTAMYRDFLRCKYYHSFSK